MTGKKNNYIKRESLIGLPVIDARKQRQIGIVKDLYINEKWTHVAGIYLTCKGCWGRNDIDIPYAS
ncbi:MAG: PRC-barrel domain containing protein, partial [Clostridiales bacterium]|nr:PRC-barrel domain containing protein [Clostridiales bacterium]